MKTNNYNYNYVVKSEPQRVQRTRKTKNISPNNLPIIYAGRIGKGTNILANPYEIGKPVKEGLFLSNFDKAQYSNGKIIVDNLEAIRLYSYYLQHIKENDKELYNQMREKAKGKNLSCWCSLDSKCHVDLLLKEFNNE